MNLRRTERTPGTDGWFSARRAAKSTLPPISESHIVAWQAEQFCYSRNGDLWRSAG